MKDQPQNQGAHMPWRERLDKMQEGEVPDRQENLPDVPEPWYVQEEKAKVEKRLREFHANLEEPKQVAKLMESYKEGSDSCQYCSGASASGCTYCELGKKVESLFSDYAKMDRLPDWEKWWGDSKNLAA